MFASLSVACGGGGGDDDDDDIIVMPDAATGTPDAATGTPDAPVGTPDAAAPDGSPPDAGPPDGSPPDAGTACTPFATGACLPGSWCKPIGLVLGVWEGACVTAGAGAAGETCAADPDCGTGLLCVIPDTIHGGASCQPVCDPAATGGDPGQCVGGADTCLMVTGEDYGACITDCSPFDSPDGCTGTQFCFPGAFDGGGGTWSGVCVTPGATGSGDSCTVAGECVADTLCADKPFPAGESDGFHCFGLCDPAVGCGGTVECVQGDDGMGGLSDFGWCVDTCAPLFEDGTAAGCDATEWCFPDLFDATLGFCGPTGTTAHGDACTLLSECVSGEWCLGAECDEICEVGAVTGPGVCSDGGDECLELFLDGDPLPVGSCIEGCDFHGAATCSAAGEECTMAELFGLAFDLCFGGITTIATGADCTAAGLADGELCGPGSVCLDSDGLGTILCFDACATTEGAFGTLGHPDCRVGTETCEDVGAGPELGLCL